MHTHYQVAGASFLQVVVFYHLLMFELLQVKNLQRVSFVHNFIETISEIFLSKILQCYVRFSEGAKRPIIQFTFQAAAELAGQPHNNIFFVFSCFSHLVQFQLHSTVLCCAFINTAKLRAVDCLRQQHIQGFSDCL